jgi:DNA repair protein RadC
VFILGKFANWHYKKMPRQLLLRTITPSGNAEPSKADIAITKKLKAALGILDIKLLDHFVIGKGEIVSLGQLGKL